ncbi:carbohydrate kinase [Proteiniclasticum sp. SCR006]|uniref:Carbohydrate kinase n=1 Tax=Proteiniclasticum aestuarii TaxID=2817862 RepID=A0A939H962_9CLOT|nr:FGGY family carbohydrate kinase [Proteiniclasticum aestuarii]MBO1265431.1 carbohydrate kinase [Proteiniclasticum aestuarii]
MNNKNYLVVDSGTGNCKIVLIEATGHIVDVLSFENKYYKDYEYTDAQYFIPQEWEEKILSACKELVNRNRNTKIDAVISTSARQSVVLYDEKGNAYYGLPNIDNRGKDWMDEITDRGEIYDKTGRWVTEDFPAAKIFGLSKKKPDLFRKMHKFTSVSEWVGSIFTGEICIEPSQACETQLYNINIGDWDEALCKSYKIPVTVLPELKDAGQKLGDVKESVLTYLGLEYGVIFIVGGADTQMALKGINIKSNEFGIISGTTSPVLTLNNEKIYDPEEKCWVNVDLASNHYVIETNPGVTGLNYQRLKNLIAPAISYEEIESMYDKMESYKCTVSLTSLDFAKKRSLGPGGIILTSPLNTMESIHDILWSAMADIACSIYTQYLNLNSMTSNMKDYIKCGGGGFRSRTLCQMLADMTDRKILLYNKFEQATTIGTIVLVNRYFGEEENLELSVLREYTPRKDSLVLQYYKDWKKNRKLISERN